LAPTGLLSSPPRFLRGSRARPSAYSESRSADKGDLYTYMGIPRGRSDEEEGAGGGCPTHEHEPAPRSKVPHLQDVAIASCIIFATQTKTQQHFVFLVSYPRGAVSAARMARAVVPAARMARAMVSAARMARELVSVARMARAMALRSSPHQQQHRLPRRMRGRQRRQRYPANRW
jgi:hypothetical protein